MSTQVRYPQISKTWTVASGLGLIAVAAAGIVTINTIRNAAGIDTRKELSDGSVQQSGSLLIKSGSLAINLRNNGDGSFQGTLTGNKLYVGSMSGAGLSDCDTAGTSKLLWDATSQRFSCGSDQNSGTTYTAGQGLTLTSTSFKTNSIMTGSLASFTTLSGSIVLAKTSLASSGSLTWEGAGSGMALYLGGTFEGVGLTDCDGDTQTLSWDATTKRFGCGDDDTGGASAFTAGQGLNLLGGSAFQLNTTITGSLVRFSTVSGATVIARDTLTLDGINISSGSTVPKQVALTTTVVANTAAETDISPTFVIPANSVKAGDTFMIVASGTGSTPAGTATGTLRIKIGTQAFVMTFRDDSGGFGEPSFLQTGFSTSNAFNSWSATTYITFRSIGASGRAVGYMSYTGFLSGIGFTTNLIYHSTGSTVNTTADQNLKMTWDWNTASTNNTVSRLTYQVIKLSP